jgi:hypothetical protein
MRSGAENLYVVGAEKIGDTPGTRCCPIYPNNSCLQTAAFRLCLIEHSLTKQLFLIAIPIHGTPQKRKQT